MASKREQAVDALLAQEAEATYRHLDIAVDVFLAEDDEEPSLSVGGRWDRVAKSYSGDAESAVRVELHPGQTESARVLVAWFRRHAELRRLVRQGYPVRAAARRVWGEEQPLLALWLYGGRRSGKSHEGCLAAALMAVMVPGAVVVIVTPTDRDQGEIRTALETFYLAPQWRKWVESESTYKLANGSGIVLHTGARRSLKVGRVDLAVVNEAQLQQRGRVDDLVGGLADVSGLLVATCNPPKDAGGQWVQSRYYDWAEGLVPTDAWHFLDPERNPHADWAYLQAQRAVLTEAEYRREVLGDMSTPIGDIVFTAWSDQAILKYIPVSWVDVTVAVTARYFGYEASIVVGADFDSRAGCSWIAGRFYIPFAEASLDSAVFVVEAAVDKILGREAKQVESIREARDRYGYLLVDPADAVVVADASGSWQDAKHQHDSDPSWAYFQRAGFHVVFPDPKQEGNPERAARFDTANDCLRATPEKPRRIYFLEDAARAIEAARKMPIKNGVPHARSEFAHVTDCWSYVVWRRWGRAGEETRDLNEPGYQGVPRQERHAAYRGLAPRQ